MNTLDDLLRPMTNHRDRCASRLSLLHTEQSKGELLDGEIKLSIEAELSSFTQMLDHMRELAIEQGGEPLDIIKSTMGLCLAERDKFDPASSMAEKAKWSGYHAAYLRMTMLDPSLYSAL